MNPDRQRARQIERVVELVCLAAALLPLAMLAGLLLDVLVQAWPSARLSFLTHYPSRTPTSAGILPGLVGSVLVVGLTSLMAVPIGVGAATYLEEFAPPGRFRRLVELNLANLAGVPSIVYGLLGLALFVHVAGLGHGLLAGALTLGLLVLPIVILATREALRAVPDSLREGALALGATRWQVTWRVVLPQATAGILTGAILGVSRAMGETAPLLLVGAVSYVTFLPTGLDSPFTTMPVQIFGWVSRPQAGFSANAAAGIVVLLLTLTAMNLTALVLRARLRRDPT
jgi:phosphate transport system permease protein